MKREQAHRRMRRDQEGFALLVVVLIVALLAVVGATLLDLVNVDLNLVGQQRRAIEAKAVADGALLEVLDDAELSSYFPTFDDPTLRRTYVANGVKDPNGTPIQLDETNSAYVQYPGTSSERTYEANVGLVRVSKVPESSTSLFRGLVYEVSAQSKLNQGLATSEVRAEIVKKVSVGRGTVIPPRHVR